MKGIDHFINLIADKLPEYEFLRMEETFMTGRELKLTGVKNYKGKPIQDDATYSIELPVMKGMVEMLEYQGMKVENHIPKPIDHKQLLRKEWLAHGLPGIYKYLGKYLTPEALIQVKNTFMKVSTNNGKPVQHRATV